VRNIQNVDLSSGLKGKNTAHRYLERSNISEKQAADMHRKTG
jgi:hypothetical protein